MTKKNIGLLIGSLREQSYSRKIASFLCSHMSSSLEMHEIEIGKLELYNQDHDDNGQPSAHWSAFRAQA